MQYTVIIAKIIIHYIVHVEAKSMEIIQPVPKNKPLIQSVLQWKSPYKINGRSWVTRYRNTNNVGTEGIETS